MISDLFASAMPNEGGPMVRLICRHMGHCQSLVSAAESGPTDDQENCDLPQLPRASHAIAWWDNMDTSITTKFDPRTGGEAPNLLAELIPTTPQRPGGTRALPETLARSLMPSSSAPHTPNQKNCTVIYHPYTGFLVYGVGNTSPGSIRRRRLHCDPQCIHVCQRLGKVPNHVLSWKCRRPTSRKHFPVAHLPRGDATATL